jgi:succinate-acetate transporter protein
MADRIVLADRTRDRETALAPASAISDPMALGLFAFAGAMFLVATPVAGWYGGATGGNLYLSPFASILGGLAQFLAAMWAYRIRDTLATSMLGVWGCAFLAYGGLTITLAARPVNVTAGFPELGYWFIVLAAVSGVGTVAASGENLVFAGWLGCATVGSILAAIGLIGGINIVNVIGAWVFIVSSLVAWYGASAVLLRATFGRAVPLGEVSPATQRVTTTDVETMPGQRRVG